MIRTYLLYVILLGWVARPRLAEAQSGSTPIFRIDRIGVKDGLTQGSVYYMLKDSRGFLWFGTQDGLNRYDGHNFRTYRPALGKNGENQPGTIRGINIFGIIEDPDGNLWIGTEDGLNRYDRERDRFECLFANERKHGPTRLTSRTMPFSVDQRELLYLSDAEGLVSYEYRTKQKNRLAALYPTKEYDLQSSAVRTSFGDVWLHASTGLVRYNLKSRNLFHYFSNHHQNVSGPPMAVSSFYIAPDNIAWLGTEQGLVRFDYRQATQQLYARMGTKAISTINSIAADKNGRLWLGTERDGVVYFDTASRMFGRATDFLQNSRSLSEFKISKIYVDKQGVIWVNPDPDGLARIIPDAFLFGRVVRNQTADTLPAATKLSNYTVRGFLEEQPNRLWILNQNGIDVLNPRTRQITDRYLQRRAGSKMSQLAVKSLYKDPQGRIWVGAEGGVMAFDAIAGTFDAIPFPSSAMLIGDNYVRNMVSTADSLLIAATEDGLYELNTRRRSWSKLPILAGQNIFSLWYNTSARQLWVGTYLNGYACFQLTNTGPNQRPAWQFVRSGLRGYMVLHIRPNPDGQTMWLATDRGAALLQPETGRFRLYTEQQGLANSFVYGTLPDAQGNVWMSTNRGISRLDPATQALKNFTPDDGLQGYEFNGNAFLKTTEGAFYMGGVNGFNWFRPADFRPSSFNPVVYINSLSINEQPFRADTYAGEARLIELKHTQNTVALEFAALDFGSNGHNNYRYQLTGYDDNWVESGKRNYVRYPNLPPDEYVFQVQATNQDGYWSDQVRRLAIHIEPPFWQTRWFLLIAVLLTALLVWVWIRQRENAIRQQQTDRVRLAYDIQEQVKKDIARDLHDEIGTRLATIKLYTTQLTRQAGETPSMLSLKATINQIINDTLSDIRNLLRKLNPKTLEQYGYVAAVEELFSRITASGLINAKFEYDQTFDESLSLPADTGVMLYRITQELVSNSLKHANARQIDLQMQQKSDRIGLIYRDNGRGFDYRLTQKKGTGLGIGNIESRVAILGGQITWQNQPEQGIQVTISIPARPVRSQGKTFKKQS